jgi:hypothetical protein
MKKTTDPHYRHRFPAELITTAQVVNLPLPDHRHHLIASQCSPGRRQVTEAKPRPLYSAMLLLDNVVEVFALSRACETPQRASTLHLRRGTRVGRVLVDGDGDGGRVARVDLRRCLAEEPLSRGSVPSRREQEVRSRRPAKSR